jgi:GAF domain-containing protein/anti-sigma regulatory factor (Ser/Thr protein kinase)
MAFGLAVAVAGPILATTIGVSWTVEGTGLPELLYILAVAAAAAAGGYVAGFIAAGLSLFGLIYYFTPPHRSLEVSSTQDLIGLVAFAVAASVATELIARQRTGRIRAQHGERVQERAVDRTARLQALTASLSEPLDLAGVARAVVAHSVEALGADAGAVLELGSDGDWFRVLAQRAGGREGVGPWTDRPVDPALPAGEAVRSGEVVSASTQRETRRRWPRLAGSLGGPDPGAVAVVPLLLEGRALGCLAMIWAEARRLTVEDREFLLAVGRQCAQAMERAHLFSSERRALSEAETARSRVAFLARFGSALSGTLEYEETLARAARMCIPELGDFVVAFLVDPNGEVERVVAVHADPDLASEVAEFEQTYRPDPRNPVSLVARVLRTHRTEMLSEVPDDFIPAVAKDDRQAEVLRALGFRSIVVAPLMARGRALGAIAFVITRGDRRFGIEDANLGEQIGRRAALAIDNARVYAAEARARSTAERALDRTSSLQRVAAALAAALTPSEVAENVVRQAVETAGAHAGAMAVLREDGAELEVVFDLGYPKDLISRFRRLPVDADLPLAQALRDGRPVLIGSRKDMADRFAGLADVAMPGSKAFAAVPLRFEGRSLGVLVTSFPAERTFDQDDVAFLEALARQSAQALERARLFEAERAARDAAEANAVRTARLQEITEILSEGLTERGVFELGVDHARKTLGAYASAMQLLSRDGKGFETVHARGYAEEVVAKWNYVSLGEATPIGDAIRDKEVVTIGSHAEYLARYPALAGRISESTEGFAAVPLLLEEVVLGALSISFREPRTFSQEDRAFLLTLGRQFAQAIQRAWLFEAERLARADAEAARERLRVLNETSEALVGSLDLDVILHGVLDRCLPTLGEAAFLILPGDGREPPLVRVAHVDRDRRAALEALVRGSMPDVPPPELVREVLLTGRAVVLDPLPDGFLAAMAEDGRHLGRLRTARSGSVIAVPIESRGTVIGALGLLTSRPQPRYGEPERALVEEVARRAALAIENARLFEAERRARSDAEAAESQLRFLAEVSGRLTSSLNPGAIVRVLVRAAINRLGDGAFVYLNEAGDLPGLEVAFADPGKQRIAKEIARSLPLEAGAARGPLEPLDSGQAVLIDRFGPDVLGPMVADDEDGALFDRLGVRSMVLAPLVGRSGALGILGVVSLGDRPLTEEDRLLIEQLATRAGLALENANLFRERTDQALTLQRSLLPPSLPSIPGTLIEARYHPAGEANEVGGDFYDVFDTEDGAWGIVIGDVCGKGTEAAALTALARHTVRTIAMQQESPRRILETLSEAILREGAEGRFVTAAYLRLRRHGPGARLTICSGGHPLPLVLKRDGSLHTVGRPGTLLGLFPEPELTDVVVDLDPGDLVLLYTDGVVEHGPDVALGEVGLASLLSRCAGLDPADVADRIEEWLGEFEPGRHRDDVALIVLSIPEEPAPLEVELGPDPRSAWTARRAIEGWAAGLPPDLVDDLRLLASELVTNSIRHARLGEGGRIELSLATTPSAVRVEVRDGGPGFESQRRTRSTALDRGWGLHLVGMLADRWGIDSDGSGRVWFEIDRVRRGRAHHAGRGKRARR